MAMSTVSMAVPIETTMEWVKANLELQLKGYGINIPTWKGNPGMGKTSHAKILADEMGLQMLYVSMNRPYEFFTGLPITNHLTVVNETNRYSNDNFTIWTCPDMIHMANKMARDISNCGFFIDEFGNKHENARGVMILLDDLQCANESVQKYFYELALERSLNNFKLDSNVCLMAAMNGSSDSGFEGFFASIISRLQVIDVYMDFEYWFKNIGITLHPFVTSFLRSDASYREEDEDRLAPFASYRSWTNFGLLLNQMYGNSTDIPLQTIKGEASSVPEKMKRLAKGFVSGAAADVFQQSVAQLLSFNFDLMVSTGKYNVEPNNALQQLMFGCIVNNIKTPEQAEAFVRYMKSLFKNDKIGGQYKNVIVSVCTTLGGLSSFIKKEIRAGRNSEEYTRKKVVIDKIVAYMWSNDYVLETLNELTL